MEFVDNLVRLSKSEKTVAPKIQIAHDKTRECVYVCLSENYSTSTNIMTNATEFCKDTNPDNYFIFMKYCNANS
jgi:hypothetical protein